MAVYVDSLMPALWRFKKACHMYADSTEELVEFALVLGLKREWLQRSILIHFDLSSGKRELAVKKGAVEVDRRWVYNRIKEARNE